MKLKKLRANYAIAFITLISTTALMIGCSSSIKDSKMKTVKKDGEVAVPSGYRSWPKFVHTIDKSTGHVREIYINKVGLTATRGSAFPAGTTSVMEIYGAKKNASGDYERRAGNRLVKGKLAKIFVMEKGEGWGKKQPKGTINNGDWAYGAYLADAKTAATQDFAACRTCHLPLANKDYIFRYDEHFDVYGK